MEEEEHNNPFFPRLKRGVVGVGKSPVSIRGRINGNTSINHKVLARLRQIYSIRTARETATQGAMRICAVTMPTDMGVAASMAMQVWK